MDPAQQHHLENDPNFHEPPFKVNHLTVACSQCGMMVSTWSGPEICPACGGHLAPVTILTLDTVTVVRCHERGEVIIDRRSGVDRGLPPW